MDHWTLHETEGIKYFCLPSFEQTGLVKHAFTTRWGGHSREEFADFNQALHVGDNPEVVVANRKRMALALGISLEDLVVGEQVHGDRVGVVTRADRGKGARAEVTAIPATDALITNEPGVALATHHADCVAIFLLDPVRRAIGLAHAGWKGTALEVGRKALLRMGDQFGTRPEDCLVGISPSIGPCCYEVDTRVRDQLPAYFLTWPGVLVDKGEGHYQFDLWEANRRSLLTLGVPYTNISVSRLCTCCHPEMFFSYRFTGGRTGRMSAVLMLRD
ncbi:MAG: peptidoglycan editing factor PgeF [Firmicutes bacterium]|nr:peptidoglycan editing factor PgeF [Bacillota bacterium]